VLQVADAQIRLGGLVHDASLAFAPGCSATPEAKQAGSGSHR
jgi:hypothetical protein